MFDPSKVAAEAIRLGAIQKPSELVPLLMFVHTLQPLVVVEIGTARGGTLWGWCQAAHPRAQIIAMDIPHGPLGGGFTEEDIPVYRGFGKPGQQLDFLLADTHDPQTLEELQGLLEHPVDFLFIDGDHTYEGVKQDFEMYSPLVRPGGLIAFHDILPHPKVPDCQVDKFWQELSAAHPDRIGELTDPRHDSGWGQWGGIGCYTVKNPCKIR